MADTCKVGLAGCGMISEVYLRNLQSLFSDRLTVLGVFDRHPDRARARAEQFGLPRVYETLEQMLSDPEIDVVLDLCPPTAHYEINRQALEAGKHVYSEKPLAAQAAQGAELVRLAREKGVRLGCAPDVPLGAMIQTARHLVDTGAIGRVVGASANLFKRGVESWHPNPNFLYQPGAGPLLDMGPYYLTALLHIVGPIECISAMDAISFSTRQITSQPHYGEVIRVNVPTYVNALLRFETGALATFTATFDVWKTRQTCLEIYGETGSLLLSDPNCFGGSITLARPNWEFEEVPLSFSYAGNSRGLGLWDMAGSVADGTVPRTDAQYAQHVLETLDAIAASSLDGTRKHLSTACGRPRPMPGEPIQK